MILNLNKNNNSYIDINKLSEDAISSVTRMNFINDKEITSFGFEEYIDNTILYFDSRLNVIKNIYRQQYKSFNRIIGSMIKELNINDDYSMNISARKPNNSFYKVISSDILKDINNVTFDKLFEDKGIGKDVSSYYFIDSDVYNKPIKLASASNVSKIKNIKNLYKSLSTEVNITNKDELRKYIKELSFPTNDITIIESYISSVIFELKQLKRNYRLETNKYTNPVKCTNVLSLLSMYRKNVINAMLNMYSVKLSIVNLNQPVNENSIDEFSFINTNIISESVYLTEGKIKELEIIGKNNINDYNTYIINIENKLDDIYNSTVDVINNSSVYTIGINKFMDANYFDNALKSINDLNIGDIDYEITRMIDIDQSSVSSLIFLDRSKYETMTAKMQMNKDIILSILKNDYDVIKSRIEYLKQYSNEADSKLSIFDRPFNKLGVYKTEYISYLQSKLKFLTNTPYMDKIVNNIEINDFNISLALQELSKRDSYNYEKNKHMLMDFIHFIRIGSNDLCNGGDIDLNICTDKLLLLYMLYFKNKINRL